MADDLYSGGDIDPSYADEEGVYSPIPADDSIIDDFKKVYTTESTGYTYAAADDASSPVDVDGVVSSTGYGYNSDNISIQSEGATCYGYNSDTSAAPSYNEDGPAPSYSDNNGAPAPASGYGESAATASYYGSQKPVGEEKKDTVKSDPGEFSFARSGPAVVHPTPTPAPSEKDELYKQKNWNREFQGLLKQPDTEGKYVALSRLANEFVFVAETYGKVIISELSVPAEEKTVRPVSIGGIAGGEKYIVQGILFKFALDISGIYGGDENAMKAAGHELIGLSNFYFTAVDGLHFPLMCLIRYCGFCLVAMSILPIGKDTLMYGSSDGGRTVHFDDDSLTSKMEQAGMKMNLKPHYAGVNIERKIVGPGDIEGHRSKDGEFYVVDFARVFPPEASLPGDAKEPGRILYKLLRPELVSTFKTPLSSDALTGWGKRDPDAKIHNAEVVEATKHLLLVKIPEFVGKLVDGTYAFDKTAEKLTGWMKEHGINVRRIQYLGLIRNLVASTGLKDYAPRALLAEIVARVLKSRVQAEWRRTVRSHYHINQESCKEQAIAELNLLLDFKSPKACSYWKTEVKQHLLSKFKGALVGDELAPEYDLRKSMGDKFVLVVHRFMALTGFRLTESALNDMTNVVVPRNVENALDDPADLFQFLRCDAESIKPCIKHTNIVDFADIQALLMGGVNQQDLRSNLTLLGAEKILHFCTALAKKAKEALGQRSDTLTEPLVRLVEHLVSVSDSLSISLRTPILVRASSLLRAVGDSGRMETLSDKLNALLKEDPRNRLALLELLKIASSRTYDVSELAARLMALNPMDAKFNMTLANHELSWIKHYHLSGADREQAMAKMLGYFSLAVQLDPSMVNRAKFGVDPQIQEAQLRVAAACPPYRPVLREFYSQKKFVTLKSASPGGGDGLLVTLSNGEVDIERLRLHQCSGLTDAGLEHLFSNISKTLVYVDAYKTAGLGPGAQAALGKCKSLRVLKTSFTATTPSAILESIANLPELRVLHFDGVADFTNDNLDALAQSPLAAKFTSLGFGGTSVTVECTPSLPNFTALKKLYLRETAMSWEQCKTVLDASQVAIFSIQGATQLADADVLVPLISLKHPTLELFISPGGVQFVFSGPYKAVVPSSGPSVPVGIRFDRRDPKTEKAVQSQFKKVRAVPPPIFDQLGTGGRAMSIIFQRGTGTTAVLEEIPGFAGGRRYQLVHLGKSKVVIATWDLSTPNRTVTMKIPGLKDTSVRLYTALTAAPVTVPLPTGTELKVSAQGVHTNFGTQRNLTFDAVLAVITYFALRKM